MPKKHGNFCTDWLMHRQADTGRQRIAKHSLVPCNGTRLPHTVQQQWLAGRLEQLVLAHSAAATAYCSIIVTLHTLQWALRHDP